MGPDHGDAQLVRLARQGSKSAFDALLDRYWSAAVSLARHHTRNWSDAEDAAQDAFVLAFRKLEQLRDAERFGGWLLSIVTRSCIETARKRRPLPVEDVSVLTQPTEEPDVSALDRQGLRDQVHQAIHALPERYRAVVVLRYGQGMSVKAIGRTLNLPLGTVVSQLFRANRILRPRLQHLITPH